MSSVQCLHPKEFYVDQTTWGYCRGCGAVYGYLPGGKFGLTGKNIIEKIPPNSIMGSVAVTAIKLPIPMILICPNCNNQHFDGEDERIGWTNPPHKSHLCHFCGCVWRPCDQPTVGVQSITTRGERDSVEVNTFTTARAFSMQEAAQFKFLEPGDVVEVMVSPGHMVRFRTLLSKKEKMS